MSTMFLHAKARCDTVWSAGMQEKMRRLTSFFLLAMLFSIAFTVDADSDSNRFTLAPELVESYRALIRLLMVA